MTVNHLDLTVSPQDKPILGVKHLLTEERELMFITSSLGLGPEASTSFLSAHSSAGLLEAVAQLSLTSRDPVLFTEQHSVMILVEKQRGE